MVEVTLKIYVLLISIIFFDIYYAIVFFIFFMPLRTFTGGYHCKTYRNCFIISNIYFIVTVHTSNFINLLNISTVCFFTTLVLIILFLFCSAPVYSLKLQLNQRVIYNAKKLSKIVIFIEAIVIVIGYAFYRNKCIFALVIPT